MTELRWSVAAQTALRAMPWQDAAAISRAVLAYAETGAGDVRRASLDPAELRLRVGSYRVQLRREQGRLEVLFVWSVV